ncbi:hypothetical protein N7536_008634 [Penicillium majusculum]|nr:hypothetical protein N7536_008634 [Penicillium majusculum]
MESDALQHNWTNPFITEFHLKHNKKNKGWEEEKEDNNTDTTTSGKSINTSRGDKAMSERSSLTERIVEHDGWPEDMMEGVVAIFKL